MRYHPRIGCTYMPNVRSRIPGDSGGYLLQTNAAGFRADRQFERRRAAGSFRAILFGDSQTAGNGVANAERYGDVLERLVPGLEVFNYGLPSVGPDQHYLAYQDCADVEHDVLVIGLYVENIVRVDCRFRPYYDADGRELIYAKPYYAVEDGQLVLHHVPVPKAPRRRAAMPATELAHLEGRAPYPALRTLIKNLGMQDMMQKLTRFQPIPDYDSPDNPRWLLLRKILETWILQSACPVLLFLIPIWPFTEQSSDPSNYLARFRELADATRCMLHDPLPDLWRYSLAERRAFRFERDAHFTPLGHRALAHSLAPVLARFVNGN